MPFPTPQGTQAIVGMMVRALRQQGHQAHLLTYAHGQPDPHTAMDVEPRRLPDWPRVRATRSGPSLGKLALDLRMVAALRAERARTGARLLVAHNVEAAWACAAAGVAPFVYFAHTSMREELPYYLPRSMHPLSRAAGDALDRGACIRAASVFALTPALAMRLSPLHPRVERVLPPFEMPAHAPPSRTAARMRVGLPQGAPIALYA
ncbi:MAG: glycosyltransferase, partial [Deltaproteobacteria bacterium]|nr:glycosyltransferase [Deltaproteobacteria bacterium]